MICSVVFELCIPHTQAPTTYLPTHPQITLQLASHSQIAAIEGSALPGDLTLSCIRRGKLANSGGSLHVNLG